MTGYANRFIVTCGVRRCIIALVMELGKGPNVCSNFSPVYRARYDTSR